MADDTERRLRDALRDANLPQAPESLRVAVQTVVASPPAPAPSRRPWPQLLPAIAAVVAMAVIVGITTGGFGRLGATVSSASPSAAVPSGTAASATAPGTTQAPEPPAPPASVRVLTAAELETELLAVRGSILAAHDVVANVGASPTHDRVVSECAEPLGACTVVAVLDGFGPALGTITIRSENAVLPPPVTADDLKAPLALRLVPGGPVELLGHVDLASGTGAVDTASLKAQTATAKPGHVVAVLAWLQSALSPSCGPMMVDVPNPFVCPGEPSFLADSPVNASTGNGFSIPDTAVQVGAFSYDKFAPSPVVDNMVGVSRRGMYLVRMVAVDTAGCPKCRGWLLVGRLDATTAAPTSTPTPPADTVHVYTPAELGGSLTQDRASMVGRVVFVEGHVDGSVLACMPDAPRCQIGRLAGTSDTVIATRYTRSLMANTGPAATNVIAIRVLATELEYLGWMGTGSTGDATATLDELKTIAAGPPQGPVVFTVRAWLGTSGPLPCPSAPGSPPPSDTPFGNGCPSSWLAASSEGTGFSMPADGVPVQYGAYQDFAPGATADSRDPKFGTYVVRLVTDTRQGSDGPRGWQVVGRLYP